MVVSYRLVGDTVNPHFVLLGINLQVEVIWVYLSQGECGIGWHCLSLVFVWSYGGHASCFRG